MAESESLGSKIGRGVKKLLKTKKIKMVIIIAIAIFAFILIITAAWKQQLLEITSGECNNNEIEYVTKIGKEG